MTCCHSPRLRNKARLGLVTLILSTSTLADHVPDHARLEWGIGLAALSTADYRGSSNTQNTLVPLPYVKYRGKRLRIDDGVEGRLFDSPDLLVTISGNGSLPSSDGNDERSGMDELDATVEIGPSIEYRLRHQSDTELWLELPLRFALNAENSFELLGEVFHPRLSWRLPAQHKYDWKLQLRGGPLFADDAFHAYYYDVTAADVTTTRPAYSAPAGYSGMRIDFTYSRRYDRLWLGGFVRYDNLDGSVIEDSPLVTNSDSWMLGIGLAWVISEG